jgi:hypothetical protein
VIGSFLFEPSSLPNSTSVSTSQRFDKSIIVLPGVPSSVQLWNGSIELLQLDPCLPYKRLQSTRILGEFLKVLQFRKLNSPLEFT